MPVIRFQETNREHARRLRVSVAFTNKRRRALAAHLEGRSLPTGMTKPVQQASPAELIQTLAVKASETRHEPASNERQGIIQFVPAILPATGDLQKGQKICKRLQPRLISLARSNTGSFRLPYGYRRAADGTILSDPGEAEAIRLAFHLISEVSASTSDPPWQPVAELLNARGHRRRNGQRWRGRDVRTLTRTTIYAGYVRHNNGGLGDDIERLSEIEQPVVSLGVFIKASELGFGKGTLWLEHMKGRARR